VGRSAGHREQSQVRKRSFAVNAVNTSNPARPRHGFTLIELLTVIGIIVILVGLIAFGITKVINITKVKSTHVELQNLRSMLSEFETVSKGLTRQSYMYHGGTRYPASGMPTPAGMDIWRDGDPSDGAASPTNPEGDPLQSPGDVKLGSGETNRYNSDAVLNTQAVMGLMKSAPNVAKTLGQLPPSQLMEKIPTGMTSNLTLDPTGSRSAVPPVPLDAWGNPIIFVPSGGLGGVTMRNEAGTFIVTSGGMMRPGDPLKPAIRPFFASAGPDGDFTTGDDNEYSFQD
jgi:prepilin-type N-terminal cleavage/methylation domain-containing protein